MLNGTLVKIKIILILVKRDYAIQFAGSILGISWALIQNLTMIGMYSVIFLVLNIKSSADRADYIPYIFTGLLFWLPLGDFIIRGTGILTENRSLIKRSPLGLQMFLWVPYVQYLIHFSITSVPVFIILYFLSWLSPFFLLSYFIAAITGFYALLLLNYFSRLNIILKDISPLVRLMSQIIFWGLPILYFPNNAFLSKINELNPLNYPLYVFRKTVLLDYTVSISSLPFIFYLLLFFIIYHFSRTKFNELVTDHL